jgi:hypothetical protein
VCVRAVRTKPDPCVLQQHDEEARVCGCFHSLSRAICALAVVWDSCLSLCSFLPRSGAAPVPLVFSRPRGTALRIFSWRWQPAILLNVTLQTRNCRRRKFFRMCVELQSSVGVSALDCLQLSPSQRKTVPTLPDPKLHPAPNSKKTVRKLQCFSHFGYTVVAIPKSVSPSSNAAKYVLQCSLNIIPATGNTASSNMPHLESIST